jgi:hypothetical protein
MRHQIELKTNDISIDGINIVELFIAQIKDICGFFFARDREEGWNLIQVLDILDLALSIDCSRTINGA